MRENVSVVGEKAEKKKSAWLGAFCFIVLLKFSEGECTTVSTLCIQRSPISIINPRQIRLFVHVNELPTTHIAQTDVRGRRDDDGWPQNRRFFGMMVTKTRIFRLLADRTKVIAGVKPKPLPHTCLREKHLQ